MVAPSLSTLDSFQSEVSEASHPPCVCQHCLNQVGKWGHVVIIVVIAIVVIVVIIIVVVVIIVIINIIIIIKMASNVASQGSDPLSAALAVRLTNVCMHYHDHQ